MENTQSVTMLKDIKNYISIQELYDINNRNYQWESFKYQLPKKYHGFSEKRLQISSAKIPPKTNFLDELQRQKKKIPGPSHYKFDIPSRPLSGKMDKFPRKTIAETIIDKSKKQNLPGPTSYFSRPKTAQQKSNFRSPASHQREHYLNEVQYLANQGPGVGQYDVTKEACKYIPGPKMKKSTSSTLLNGQDKSKSKQKYKKIQYSILPGTFEWISKQKKKDDSRYFGKMKRFVVGSKYDKKPGPNAYKLKTDWKSQTNIHKLMVSPSSITCKSVYYG